MNSLEKPACNYNNHLKFAGGDLLFPACYNSVLPTTSTHISANSNNNIYSVGKPRKRSRDSMSLISDDVPSQIYNHMLAVDRLVARYNVNVRMELSQKRKQFSSQIIAALNEHARQRLRCKDEEIQQLRNLNSAMEEKIKSLAVESNTWKCLAQRHEAAASVLKASLEQVLAEQAAVLLATDDAESCCGDNAPPPPLDRPASATTGRKMRCRNCGDGEPSVLLLPCRHLCLCPACGPLVDTCPICKCTTSCWFRHSTTQS